MNSLLLLAGHMLGDYILQTDHMATFKLKSAWVRAYHVSVYCLCFLPLMPLAGLTDPGRLLLFLILLWATHFATDCRRWASADKWPPKPILIDQSIHIVTLALMGRAFGL